MDIKDYKDKRVLITGHTGFKGSWLSEILLMASAEVHGFALEPETKPALFSQLRLARRIASHTIGDIRDAEAVDAAVAGAMHATATAPTASALIIMLCFMLFPFSLVKVGGITDAALPSLKLPHRKPSASLVCQEIADRVSES